MADVKYLITADAKGAVTEIKKVEGAIQGMKTQATQSKSPISGMWKQIGAGIGVAGLAAGGARALKNAIRGAVRFMGECITKAGEQEKVLKQLETVLTSTGGAAGLTKEEIMNMASELQSITTFGDEAIISGQNLLLTFTNIGEEVFPQATETMLDMSVALGQDMKASAVQLGKALNDPILGVTALRRVGVNFSKAQGEMIKKMVESGDVMGAQKFILQELQTEFGGAARAAGETFPGKLEKLENTFGDLQEEIGESVTESQDFIDALEDINQVMKDIIDSGIIPEWIATFSEGLDMFFKYTLVGQQLKAVASQLHKNAEKSRELKEEAEALKFAVKMLDKGLLKLGIDVTNIIPGWERLNTETGKGSDSHEKLKTKIKELEEPFGAHEKRMMNLTHQYAAGEISLGQYTNKLSDLIEKQKELNKLFTPEEFPIAEMAEEEVAIFIAEMESAESAQKSVFEQCGLDFLNYNLGIKEVSETTVQEISEFWQGFSRDVGTIYGDLVWDLTDKNSTFEESLENFFENWLNMARSTFSNIVSEWVEGAMKDMITGSETAGQQIAQNLGQAVGGEGTGSVAEGFTNVGSAASSLLPTITAISSVVGALAGVAALVSKPKGFSEHMWYLRETQERTQEIRDYMFLVQRHWITVDIPERISHGLAKQDITNRTLRACKKFLENIEAHTKASASALSGSEHAQTGLDMIARKPTWVQTHPRERLIVQTVTQQATQSLNVRMGALPISLVLDGREIAMAVAKYMPELSEGGHMKFHERGLIKEN